MRTSGFLLLLTLPLFAQDQRLSFGITGGVNLGSSNDVISSTFPLPPDGRLGAGFANINKDRFSGGFSIEAYLNQHVSLDFNPMFHKTRTTQSSLVMFGSGPNVVQTQTTTVIDNYAIDLPVIGKYTFRDSSKRYRPFAGAGFAFGTAWQNTKLSSTTSTVNLIPTTTNNYDTWAPYDVGAVFSAGLRTKRGPLQFVPELRYTRWGGANATHQRNQAEFLFSVRF